MLRRPAFWIAFTALSVAAAIFTFKNFSTAFPLVSIDLRMDRAEALRLRYFAGLDCDEIAPLMSRSEAAVKMLVHRGLRELREELEEKER